MAVGQNIIGSALNTQRELGIKENQLLEQRRSNKEQEKVAQGMLGLKGQELGIEERRTTLLEDQATIDNYFNYREASNNLMQTNMTMYDDIDAQMNAAMKKRRELVRIHKENGLSETQAYTVAGVHDLTDQLESLQKVWEGINESVWHKNIGPALLFADIDPAALVRKQVSVYQRSQMSDLELQELSENESKDIRAIVQQKQAVAQRDLEARAKRMVDIEAYGRGRIAAEEAPFRLREIRLQNKGRMDAALAGAEGGVDQAQAANHMENYAARLEGFTNAMQDYKLTKKAALLGNLSPEFSTRVKKMSIPSFTQDVFGVPGDTDGVESFMQSLYNNKDDEDKVREILDAIPTLRGKLSSKMSPFNEFYDFFGRIRSKGAVKDIPEIMNIFMKGYNPVEEKKSETSSAQSS